MPILYVVATPIGNLEDISPRALRILREVKLIAAEDTRKTRNLLTHFDIKTPLTSYFEHNKVTKLDYILAQLKENDVALVSDAGMPGISDPGYELISAASQQDITVVPVPGPSAIISALAVSGLPTDSFKYIGFLPPRSTARRRALEEISEETASIVVLEAPHRIPDMLQDVLAVLGDRRIAVCRELTKLHEEVFRGTVAEAIKHFAAPRGEFTIVIAGRSAKEKPAMTVDIASRLRELQRKGVPAKEAVAGLAEETGLKKKELYQKWLDLQK
jgi:16S rRNA (cytidine1402-2'-O)-methyltransferase